MTDSSKKMVDLPDTMLTKKDEDIVGEYREEVTHGDRGIKGDKTGLSKKLTFIVALAWALFQMSTASWLLLDTLYVKAYHLAFALALVFLNLPTLKSNTTLSGRWDLRILLAMKRVTLVDWFLGLLAVVSALYIVIDYAGISERPGQPIGRDLIFGVMLIALLLEGVRRVSSPALPVISI